MYQDEIKRRLNIINRPINESIINKDYIRTTLDGAVKAVSVDDASKRIHNDYGMVSGINSQNWRYRDKLKTVYWNTQPTDDDKIKVDDFLHRNGITNYKHKNMYSLNESGDVNYDAAEDFMERKDKQLYEIANFLKTNKNGNIPWKTVSATLVKKTWLIFGKYNKINDNDIDKIADQILTNIVRLTLANEFTGHSENYHLREEIDEMCGIEFTDAEWENVCDRFEDGSGYDYISDYGIKPLQNIYSIIFNADTPENKLYACDKALNVVHQRNDLASMFIEGGSSTLNQIASQCGYDAGYEYGQMNKEFREGFGGNPDTDKAYVKDDRWTVKWNTAKKTPLMKENMFPKEFNRHSLGSCMAAAEMATNYFLKKGIKNFKVVEGWVSLSPDLEDDESGYESHTWIEFSNGRIFDPTRKQWRMWGYDPDGVKIQKISKTFTPEEYLDLCQLHTTLKGRCLPGRFPA